MRRSRVLRKFDEHNFLHHEVANRILENLELINFEPRFALEIGALDGYLASLLSDQTSVSACQFEEDLNENSNFAPNFFDLVVSNLNLHFVNEVPQFLLQTKNLLKPDGVFIASFFGEENLLELGEAMRKSEIEICGGISPRMPPTIDVKTAANLLQKAGFKNPVSTLEKIEVSYSDPLALLKDLQMMGQGNILTERSRIFFTKKLLAKFLQNYRNLATTSDGKVLARFEIVTMIGKK